MGPTPPVSFDHDSLRSYPLTDQEMRGEKVIFLSRLRMDKVEHPIRSIRIKPDGQFIEED
jgi:hypothetical protein